MNIGLIALSGVRVRTKELAELGVTLPGFVRRGKVIASLPSLGLLTVAALTPPGHEVTYLEVAELKASEGVKDVRASSPRPSPPAEVRHPTEEREMGAEGISVRDLPQFELVGISSLSAQIDEAYAIADAYRARGTPVVMGGVHVSSLPDEALQHCDAVVIGGAEGVWPQVVKDAASGKLKAKYYGATDEVYAPASYVQPRFELLAGRPYNRITVQTSRGCPRACEFCAASLLIAKKFNQKPVSLVMKEIRSARQWIDQPFFEFADDNTFLNKQWGKELLRELIPEEIRWFTETDASVADDIELCDLLAESGCRQVLIGFESPVADDLNGLDPVNWKRQRAPELRRVIDTLQSRGVSVNGCFILGLDSHTPEVFPQVLDFVKSSGLAEVQYTVLTPFPGSPLTARLKREGRLLQENYWDRCTLFDVNYQPKQMSVAELEAGMRWLFQETYGEEATAQRKKGFIRQVKEVKLKV